MPTPEEEHQESTVDLSVQGEIHVYHGVPHRTVFREISDEELDVIRSTAIVRRLIERLTRQVNSLDPDRPRGARKLNQAQQTVPWIKILREENYLFSIFHPFFEDGQVKDRYPRMVASCPTLQNKKEMLLHEWQLSLKSTR